MNTHVEGLLHSMAILASCYVILRGFLAIYEDVRCWAAADTVDRRHMRRCALAFLAYLAGIAIFLEIVATW